MLLSCDGPFDSVLKVKPPLVFGRAEVEQLVGALSELLDQELTAERWEELMALEEEHWGAVVGPRMERYARNQRQLLGGPARL